jgi:predicted protein tyrosine phosphatase
MSRILVSPLSAIDDAILRYRPSHMVTLLSPEHMIETPQGFERARHLKLGVNDIIDISQGTSPPARAHIDQLIAFAREWQAEAPLLIHCWAGVSRSMAAAYTILCDRLGAGCEKRVASALRARAPYAWPNALMVKFADEALEREGRMVEAIHVLGYGAPVVEGVCTEFPLVEL